jgi:hypothetical protein
VASWQTLTINGTSYVRSAVERGEQVLPIGQPEPLRFVFSVDGELDGDDLQVVREVVRGLKHARGTKAKLEVSEGNDVLCVEGFGSRKQAGQGGILLLLVRHAIREGIRGSASEPPPGKQPEHGQLLLALAHSLLEDAAVVQLVDRLELREIELRSTEEVVEFEQLVQDRHLTRRVTIVGRTVRLAKAFAPVPKARELLLSFLGLEPVARAFKAAVDRVRRGATG